ncbi:SprT family zinc-dependent metalloprotease [Limnohabitans sp. Rim8]|uniref:M48 family metallopeptidase n=1 Tax=Limnohabitans sp. Rim8 TaxID=1100718 RepID=UPI00261F5119|nr:SprT family zinc-dependent metalloprotease [Limnohabitans sp. Rim8]
MRAPLQFVLDFFTGGDPVVTSAPPPAQASSHAPTSGADATARVPTLSTEAALPAAAGFVHPAANRHAQLQGVSVSFRFERSRRRSIGFLVGADGLVVRAPNWVTLREVDAAVQEKSAWIVAKLQQFKERQTEQFQKAIEWRHGAEVPFLGRTVQLCVLERGVGRVLGQDLSPEHVLPVTVPPNASVTQVRDAAQVWLKKQAKLLFEERLRHFAPLLGVRWQKLSLSSASTRWGSARNDGHIRLNWRLIHLPISQIDYVVVHELAHLREMNHSPRFWETVGEVMPDYAQRRKALRQSPVGLADD